MGIPNFAFISFSFEDTFDPIPKFLCNLLCDKGFETKRHFMVHKKSEHTEHASDCWGFSKGKCDIGDKLWFNHREISNTTESTEVECNIFDHISNLLHHKKSEHVFSVPRCQNTIKRKIFLLQIKK